MPEPRPTYNKVRAFWKMQGRTPTRPPCLKELHFEAFAMVLSGKSQAEVARHRGVSSEAVRQSVNRSHDTIVHHERYGPDCAVCRRTRKQTPAEKREYMRNYRRKRTEEARRIMDERAAARARGEL